MKHLAILALSLLLLMPLARADFDSAMSAYQRKDYVTAADGLQELAGQGHTDAQFMLGYLYALGQGVVQDYVEAHRWFNLAAARGKVKALDARDEIAGRMTPAQVGEAQRLARAWRAQPATEATRSTDASALVAQVRPPTAEPASHATVLRVQTLLTELGYDPGTADGVIGRKTGAAIREYQADSALRVDGKVSAALGEHLEHTLAKADAAATAAAVPDTDGDEKRSRLQVLVDDLRALIRDGERASSADRAFLRDLAALARRYDWPWQRLILRERFEDGDYDYDPQWRVVAGEFRVNARDGLQSSVQRKPPPRKEPAKTTEQQAMALLGALIRKQVLGQSEEPRQDTEPARAEIVLSKSLGNAFALRIQFSSHQGQGRLEMGPYRANDRSEGYSIAYNPGARRGLELLRYSASGTSVVAVHDQVLALEDGQPHDVQWTRDGDGVMAVALDGEEILRVTDRGIGGDFAEFVLVNHGGSYAVHEIEIFGM